MPTTSSIDTSTTSSIDPSSSFFNQKAEEAKKSDEADFMLLLLAQLKNQNPQEPMSNAEMMTQMAQLTTVQELKKLSAELDKFGKSNSIGYAASLVGKYVTAKQGEDGETIEGYVDEVEVSDASNMKVIIGDQTLSVADILTIS